MTKQKVSKNPEQKSPRMITLALALVEFLSFFLNFLNVAVILLLKDGGSATFGSNNGAFKTEHHNPQCSRIF